MTLYSFIVHLSFCSYMSADNMFSTYWGLIKVDRYRKTELYCFFKIKLLKGIQICVCVCVGVRGSVTWPVLDNRPLHALISTCVKQWLLGDRDGLTQEEISAKHRTGTKRWKKTGGGGSRKHASISCRRCVCVMKQFFLLIVDTFGPKCRNKCDTSTSLIHITTTCLTAPIFTSQTAFPATQFPHNQEI